MNTPVVPDVSGEERQHQDNRNCDDDEDHHRPVVQCAEWAGHSVAVLHQIYAKVIAGLESAAHERIEKALGWES